MREKWKDFRRRHPSRLTRKQKIVRNALCVLLLLAACYRLADCPPLTAMHAFRQAERQALVGPSEVIARIPGEAVTVLEENVEQFADRTVFGQISDWFLRDMEDTREFVVGEKDGTFYCFRWEEDSSNNWLNPTRGYLSAGEKTGEVTVMPIGRYLTQKKMFACFVYIQAELEEAAYACVEVRAVRPYKEAFYTSWCSGEGEVHGDGVFVIAAFQSSEPVETTREEYEAMEDLIEARVVLKNAAGDVIYDETLIV